MKMFKKLHKKIYNKVNENKGLAILEIVIFLLVLIILLVTIFFVNITFILSVRGQAKVRNEALVKCMKSTNATGKTYSVNQTVYLFGRNGSYTVSSENGTFRLYCVGE